MSEEIQPMPFSYPPYAIGRTWLFLPVAIFAWLSSPPLLAQCDFTEVSSAQNITHQFHQGTLGSGVSFMDFDGDGWDDLTFGTSEGELVEVYKNNQGQFEKITLEGVTNTCESKQITWVDFDNDGDKDLYYSCVGSNIVLYRNNGDMSFTEVTEELGLVSPIGTSMGANWADFDRDGWLDLYVTYYGGTRNLLYRNINGTAFENITIASNAAPTIKPTFCGVVFDHNNDGWEDIYLANDRSTRNDLISNNGNLTFEDVSATSQSDLPMDAMGTTLLDMNRDGYFEVYISNSPAGNALILNNGDGTFTDIAESSGTIFNSVGWGVNTLDFDNDSYWDLYVSGSEIGTEMLSSALYRATGEMTFELTEYEGMATDTMSSFSNAVGDFNRDGRMDIAVSNSNGTFSQLWQNSCTNENHWLKVKLQGTLSNRDGIGARVIAHVNGTPLYQYMTAGTGFMAQNTDYLHFGLAGNAEVDSLFVEWPSGLIDKILKPGVDQTIMVIEGEQVQQVAINTSVDPTSLCEGEEIILMLNIFAQDIDITWSDGTKGTSLTTTESGTYSATIIQGTSTYQSEELEIQMNEFPEVTVETSPAGGAEPGSISLTEINGPNSYRWSHDPLETRKDLTGLTAGVYQVRITSQAGCELTLNIEVEASIVTSLDDPLISEISYKLESGRLVITLPQDLVPKLKESRLLNGRGQELQLIKTSDTHDNEIRFDSFPTQQLIIVQMLFTDGKVVRKLMLRD